MTLAGKTLKSTYKSLLRVDDNSGVGGTSLRITDGEGNNTGIKVSDRDFTVEPSVNGNAFVKNNMTWNVVLPKYIQFYEDLLKD